MPKRKYSTEAIRRRNSRVRAKDVNKIFEQAEQTAEKEDEKIAQQEEKKNEEEKKRKKRAQDILDIFPKFELKEYKNPTKILATGTVGSLYKIKSEKNSKEHVVKVQILFPDKNTSENTNKKRTRSSSPETTSADNEKEKPDDTAFESNFDNEIINQKAFAKLGYAPNVISSEKKNNK